MFVPVKFLLLNSCVYVCVCVLRMYIKNGTNHVFYGELNVVTMFMILFCACVPYVQNKYNSVEMREHAHLFIFVLVLFCSGYFEKIVLFIIFCIYFVSFLLLL